MITNYCNGEYVSHTGVELGFFSSRFWKNHNFNVDVLLKQVSQSSINLGICFRLGEKGQSNHPKSYLLIAYHRISVLQT